MLISVVNDKIHFRCANQKLVFYASMHKRIKNIMLHIFWIWFHNAYCALLHC